MHNNTCYAHTNRVFFSLFVLPAQTHCVTHRYVSVQRRCSDITHTHTNLKLQNKKKEGKRVHKILEKKKKREERVSRNKKMTKGENKTQ